jgi:hypothetical protein
MAAAYHLAFVDGLNQFKRLECPGQFMAVVIQGNLGKNRAKKEM